MRAADINSKSVFKGALILSAGGLAAKIAGAAYRIPLTNILGAEGMGLYQMIFPFYALLLAATGSGIPSALSRMTAEKLADKDYAGAARLFKSAYFILSAAGLVFSAGLYFCADIIAAAQGNIAAAQGYRMISPCVFLVAQIAVLRGYFQGGANMAPTALSQIIEQGAKILFAFGVAMRFLPDLYKAVYFSIFAVTVSEIAALLFLMAYYAKHKYKNPADNAERGAVSGSPKPKYFLNIISACLPVTISSVIFPLSSIIDSALILNALPGGGLELYGLLSAANALVSFPSVIASAVAASAIPSISAAAAKGDLVQVAGKAQFALKLTLFVALPAAAGMAVFSRGIIGLVYGGFGSAQAEIAANLLKIGSVSALFLCLMQTAVSILLSLKRSFAAAAFTLLAVVFKISLSSLLINVPFLNIYGCAISAAACYFTAAMLNLIYLARCLKSPIAPSVYFKPAVCAAAAVSFSAASHWALSAYLSQNLSLLMSVAASLPVMVFFSLKTRLFSEGEIGGLKIFKRKTV